MCCWGNSDLFNWRSRWKWAGLCESMHVQVGNTIFNVGVHACKYVCSCFFPGGLKSVCTVVCVVREVGGYCLYKCMATHMFVGATMRHIQHMLPSSSPFRGRLSHGTQHDSVWHDPGEQHGAWSRGPQGSACGLEKAQDLFVSSLSLSVHLREQGGGLHHTYGHMHMHVINIEMYTHYVCLKINDLRRLDYVLLLRVNNFRKVFFNFCQWQMSVQQLRNAFDQTQCEHMHTHTKHPCTPTQMHKCKLDCLQMHISTFLQP